MATSRPTQTELLDALQDDQQRFNKLIGRLSDAEQEQPFTPEGWSVKDFLAHMTHWKRATHASLIAETHDQPLPPPLPPGDEANAAQLQQDRSQSLSLADRQADWQAVHTYLIHVLVDELDDEKLREEIRVPWDEHEIYSIGALVQSMCEHDAEHFDLIEQHFKQGS